MFLYSFMNDIARIADINYEPTDSPSSVSLACCRKVNPT